MKMTKYSAGLILSLTTGLALVSGCVVEPDGRVGFQPVVVVAPAPVVYAPAPDPIMVPDSYVWDGYENVGFVGGQYYYLGAGNVWIVADPYRIDRFHGWERGHPDWRDRAIRNDRFRRDSRGRVAPRNNHEKHQAFWQDNQNLKPVLVTSRTNSQPLPAPSNV